MKKTDRAQTLFPSMSAASGALGVPVTVLRQAKRAGAAGFTSAGRVDALKLLHQANDLQAGLFAHVEVDEYQIRILLEYMLLYRGFFLAESYLKALLSQPELDSGK